MGKIEITYISDRDYIFVKTIRPPTIVGHQALKNQDFIDHEYWPTVYSFYKQVTEKNIIERYSTNVRTLRENSGPNPNKQEVAFNKDMGMAKKHAIPVVEDKPIYRIPKVRSK